MAKDKRFTKGFLFKFDLKMVDVVKDDDYSISKLGGMKVAGKLSPHMAQIMSDVITHEGGLHPLELMVLDLMTGIEGPEHLRKKMGLGITLNRCEELWRAYTRIRALRAQAASVSVT